MASLEDTFRMMKGEEPVNTDKLTEQDKVRVNIKQTTSGNLGGSITKDLLNSIKNTLTEHRNEDLSESPTAAPVEEVKKYRDGLVNAGKVMVASLNAIEFGHESKPHDLNNLIKIEDDMRNLSGHLTMFPELRRVIKSRVKFPPHPKRKQRPGP